MVTGLRFKHLFFDVSWVVRRYDLALADTLTSMPRKVFVSNRPDKTISGLVPIEFPTGTTVSSALDRVLRLVSVGSKRFLTNKVDRSVTGLIAQQQCVG